MDRLALLAATAVCAASICARAEIVPVSTTIQAAVDAAKPGDIVFVPPGTYRETVTVEKDNITIIGPESAVIDASGFANGIHVGANIFTPATAPVCPAIAVRNFTIIGLTIRDADYNGIFLSVRPRTN